MKFHPTTRTLELERKDCRTCEYGAGERGQYTGSKVCPACNGTGNGPRGGKGGCRQCYHGKQHDFENPIVCPACDGKWQNAAMESFCDTAPVEGIDSMPLFLVVLERDNTWNENYLGAGCLWSATDYGDARRALALGLQAQGEATREALTNAAQPLLAEIRKRLHEDRTQAVKIVRPYERGDEVATLHDALLLCVTNTGYSVRAMSDLPDNFRDNCVPEIEGATA